MAAPMSSATEMRRDLIVAGCLLVAAVLVAALIVIVGATP
jgi:hypothetical protein